MSKNTLIFVLFIVGIGKSYAQFNYVNNPSFEIYDSLPVYYPDSTLYAHNYFAKDWFIPVSCWNFWYRNELLNAMDTAGGYPISVYGVPQNPWDECQPVDGYAYASMRLYTLNGGPEGNRIYLESKLLSPLNTDKDYCLNFYITLIDSSKISINEIGVCFTSDTLENYTGDDSDSCYININPQIVSPVNEYFNIRNKWYQISGIYHASGGEQFITIGNFKGPGFTNFVFVPNCGNFYAPSAGYNIDMITLYECNPNPAIAFAGNDTSICPGDSVRLGVLDSITGYNYLWTPATGMNDSSASNPIVSPPTTTTYLLQQSYYSTIITTDEVTVTVMDCDPEPQENAIFIPNVFTPNKDGNNDIFYIRGQNISSLDLIIYNRWGSQVYKSSELLHGWDGQYNGIDCPSGVYFFNAKVTFSDRQTETHHGSITLLR